MTDVPRENQPIALRRRLRACRSFFVAPGPHPTTFPLAAGHVADAIVVDLTAASTDAERRLARENLFDFLREDVDLTLLCLARIHPIRSATGLEDLLALRQSASLPDAIVVSDCRTPYELALVADIFAERRAIGVVPMLDRAESVLSVERFSIAHPQVCGLMLSDVVDDEFSTAQRWEHLVFARSRLAAASSIAGIAAIDAATSPTAGDIALRREASAGRLLGMTGKCAVDADQIGTINELFVSPCGRRHR